MHDSEHDEVFHPDELAQRSASSLIFQGMNVTGLAAGGLGTLVLGAAALKAAFKGGDGNAGQSPAPKDE